MKVGASLKLLSLILFLSCSGLMYAADQASAASQCVECYAMWYGWSEMQRDVTEIRELAAEMRRNHITATGKSGGIAVLARKSSLLSKSAINFIKSLGLKGERELD